MADVAEALNVVRNALAGNRYRYLSEKDLQAGLAAALAEAGLDAHREQQITGGRIDFLVNLGLHVVGVEVKVKGNVDALRRQIERYAEDVGVHADAGGEDDRVSGPFCLGHGPTGREPGVALVGSFQQQAHRCLVRGREQPGRLRGAGGATAGGLA